MTILRAGRRFVLVVVALSLARDRNQAALAHTAPEWQPPIELAVTAAEHSGDQVVIYPVVAADGSGNAHAFWQTSLSDDMGTVESTIEYARYSAGEWTTAIDVFYAPRVILWAPQVAVDALSKLHLVWELGPGGDIIYASAPAATAESAQDWSPPQTVVGGRTHADGEMSKAIAVTPDGELHLVYCTGSEHAAVEYVHLNHEWSTPTTVQRSTEGYCRVNLARDGHGRLHVVYVFAGEGGNSIYYTQSDDEGTSWTTPIAVARWRAGFDPGYSPNFPSVVVHGDQVHIGWLGYPRTQRWHQWSRDRGASWDPATPLSPNLYLATDAPAMLVGRTGVLHLATVGDVDGMIERVYYTTWEQGTWMPLASIHPDANERAALALTTGGTLLLVWDNDEGARMSIMASSLELADAAAPLPLPSVVGNPASVVERVPTAKPAPATAAGSDAPALDPAPSGYPDAVSNAAVSALAAGAIVVGTMTIILRRRARE